MLCQPRKGKKYRIRKARPKLESIRLEFIFNSKKRKTHRIDLSVYKHGESKNICTAWIEMCVCFVPHSHRLTTKIQAISETIGGHITISRWLFNWLRTVKRIWSRCHQPISLAAGSNHFPLPNTHFSYTFTSRKSRVRHRRTLASKELAAENFYIGNLGLATASKVHSILDAKKAARWFCAIQMNWWANANCFSASFCLSFFVYSLILQLLRATHFIRW